MALAQAVPTHELPDEMAGYIDALYREEVLTESEERDLAYRARNGDGVAREELARRNLRLVVSIAKHYKSPHTNFMDLIQEGNRGLLKALDRFDCTLGYRFSTYATWWIKSHVLDAVGQAARGLRIPAHRLGEVGLPEPMSFENNVSVVEAVMAQQETTMASPEGEVHARVLSEQVKLVLGELTEREREVITARFGLDGRESESLEFLGQRYGITRERVRQIEARALEKLQRSPLAYKRLRDFYLD
jgi:RNA polymerase primary sigma factor